METEFCGPPLPPQFRKRVHAESGSDPNSLDHNSEQSERVPSVQAKKHSDKRKHKVQAKLVQVKQFMTNKQTQILFLQGSGHV